MSTRTASITRNTNETQIELSLNLDGKGAFDIQLPREAGAPFWQHMLEQWSKHGASISPSRPRATFTSTAITSSKTWALRSGRRCTKRRRQARYRTLRLLHRTDGRSANAVRR
jgi:hypothetical protein